MVDERKIVYASPGDDLENPGAYHKECYEALNIFLMLSMSEPDKNQDQLVKTANKLAGVEIKTREKKLITGNKKALR